MIRINKYISMCGVTSRRGAEALITGRRVTLNGATVQKPGVIVDETTDVVKIDGTVVTLATQAVYVALNKPKMVMTTLFDPFKRRTVKHCLEGLRHRVYPVGRLDYDVQGVLLLTNDGELAFRLTHPKYEVKKTYEARVQGQFKTEDAGRLCDGLPLEDGYIGRAQQVSILGYVGKLTRIRLVLTEGRKREVKQLCRKVGHAVEELTRVDFAGITLKNLRPGQWRHLTEKEVARLRELVGL
ncbi:MAG TPA: pseudouridine synthase [Acidobacteriota bacterium]|nr:pseudouridine synthase [Acidobacteriota bacterium]